MFLTMSTNKSISSFKSILQLTRVLFLRRMFCYTTYHIRSYEMDFLLRLVFVLVSIGFPFWDVDHHIQLLAHRFGLQIFLSAAHNMITICANNERLHNKPSVYYLPLKKNIPGPFQLDIIEDYGRFLSRCFSHHCSILNMYRELVILLTTHRSRSIVLYLVSGALSSGSFVGLLPGTGWIDVVGASFGGFVVQFILIFSSKQRFLGKFFSYAELMISFSVALIIVIFSYVFPINLDNVIIASLGWFLPGITLSISTMELSTGNTVLGTNRFFTGIIIAFSLSFGTTFAVNLMELIFGSPNITFRDGFPSLFSLFLHPYQPSFWTIA
ncbi:hypothetical protein GEMRC1_007659 [Eukaryota sp. GEM-RC1]